ncbi:MAG: BRCT domain-containing protein [Candidatus Brocadiae bacterium]|nr:BRCT domain-containing protein [Candidatus Brocadiia bacterium]
MNQIAGCTFCITGKLENFTTKAEAYAEIAQRGGNGSKSLTTGCDFLVLGAKGNENYAFGRKGTKQVQAEGWIREGRGIQIITENQLIALVEAAAEVPACERGQTPSDRPTVRRSAIARESVGDLQCDWCFHEPRPEASQVLRVTYQTAPLPPDVAESVRVQFQALKGEAKRFGWRNRVRTELVPVSWSVQPRQDGSERLQEEELILSARMICILEDEAAKAAGIEMADRVKRIAIGWGLGGRLSVRIWDAAYRYGAYWLDRLGG